MAIGLRPPLDFISVPNLGPTTVFGLEGSTCIIPHGNSRKTVKKLKKLELIKFIKILGVNGRRQKMRNES